MRYMVISHKHGVNVHFAATEEALWTEIAECFDEEEVQILKGDDDAPGDGPFIDHHGDVPDDPRIATMLEALIAMKELFEDLVPAHRTQDILAQADAAIAQARGEKA